MPGKLLYTASTYSHIANFHLPYLRAFREAGWIVHVACGGTAMALPEADRVVDVPFAKRMTAPENLGCARRLGELMKREAYDLVITHTSLAAFFTRLPLLGRKDRPRVINTVHGYLFDDDTTVSLSRSATSSVARLSRPGLEDRNVNLARRSVQDSLMEDLRRLDPDVYYGELLTTELPRLAECRAEG